VDCWIYNIINKTYIELSNENISAFFKSEEENAITTTHYKIINLNCNIINENIEKLIFYIGGFYELKEKGKESKLYYESENKFSFDF